MKRFFLSILLMVFAISCDDDPSTPPPPVTTTHVIRDVDYIADTYFYLDYPDDSFLPGQEQTVAVYRTVTLQDLNDNPAIIRIPGWAIMDPIGGGQSIRDAAAAINAGSRPQPVALTHQFTLLTPGTDYSFILDSITNDVIGIALTRAVPPSALKSIGVTYVTTDGDIVGGSYSSLGVVDAQTGSVPPPYSPGDSLMLKMIKAPDPNPNGSFASTWPLMMRNKYDTGFRNIDIGSVSVTVEELTTRPTPVTPEGSDVPYLQIFGLDQTGTTGTGPPDGKVESRWIDLEHGILSFPAVRSFAPDPSLVDEWTDGGFAFTGIYQTQYDKSQRIYDEALNDIEKADVHQYLIKFAITTPAP